MTTFTEDETRRYSRQLLLDGFGIEGQRRLRDSRVIVVGAGARLACGILSCRRRSRHNRLGRRRPRRPFEPATPDTPHHCRPRPREGGVGPR